LNAIRCDHLPPTQINGSIVPPSAPPHPPHIHHALLSTLAKSILLQAETEVTAEKRSAKPLAHVAANLLGALSQFPEVFFAKLVQHTGGWAVPAVIPPTDVDGQPWASDEARAKVRGYRNNGSGELESAGVYVSRMTGMMRVYFEILKVPVRQPLDRMFQMPRYWMWFARMTSQRMLLATAFFVGITDMASSIRCCY
jgi:nucleoporin GLE1